jgi:DNA modification methylase
MSSLMATNGTVRIIHGDCLRELKELPDGSVDAIITDPPYGIGYQSQKRADGSRLPRIANDDADAPFIWFLYDAYRVLKDGGAMLCCVRHDVEHTFRLAMRIAGFAVKAQLVWDKVQHGMGDAKGDWASRHENLVFAVNGSGVRLPRL